MIADKYRTSPVRPRVFHDSNLTVTRSITRLNCRYEAESDQLAIHHLDRRVYCYAQSGCISPVLSSYVKGCAMIHRGSNERDSHGRSDAIGKIVHLYGDMALVMVKRHDGIELTRYRPIED